jgi:DNA-binding transcriptional regulator YiaG
MTATQLRELRKDLDLSISWCARNLSRTSVRAWSAWEAGRSPVPKDVKSNMIEFYTLAMPMLSKIRPHYAA